MNVLTQVAPLFRVSFVGPREPLERRPELLNCLAIEVILICGSSRNGLFPSHTQGSRWSQDFLTSRLQLTHVADSSGPRRNAKRGLLNSAEMLSRRIRPRMLEQKLHPIVDGYGSFQMTEIISVKLTANAI